MPYILRIFGTGTPHILGYLQGGGKNWGCRISYDTGFTHDSITECVRKKYLGMDINLIPGNNYY